MPRALPGCGAKGRKSATHANRRGISFRRRTVREAKPPRTISQPCCCVSLASFTQAYAGDVRRAVVDR